MKRKSFERLMQACLVGSAVAGGCNRQEVPVAKNDGDLLAPVGAWAQKDPKPTKRPDDMLVPASYVAPDQAQPMLAKRSGPAANLPPVVFADPSTSPSSPTPASAMPNPLPAETMAAAVPVNSKTTTMSAAHAESVKGASRYGHAPDYSWVCGEVMHTRKGWRLRYASLDETDTYGGSVTLADDPRLADLKEGEIFVLDGHLQDPDLHISAPVYVVSDVKPQGH